MLKIFTKVSLLFMLLQVLPTGSQTEAAEVFSARVIGVSDGDTVTVVHAGRSEKLRLNGIDCPEKAQDFGKRAKEFTAAKTLLQTVTVKGCGKDRYQRTIAEVYLAGGENLSDLLLSNGYAWWYQKYSRDTQRAMMQEKAKQQKLGLWSMESATAPWDFRKAKQASKTPAKN